MRRYPLELFRDVDQKLLVRLCIVGDAERGRAPQGCGCTEDTVVRASVKPGKVNGSLHVQVLRVSKIVAFSIMPMIKEEGIHIEDIQCPLASSMKRDSAIDQRNQHIVQSKRGSTKSVSADCRQLMYV